MHFSYAVYERRESYSELILCIKKERGYSKGRLQERFRETQGVSGDAMRLQGCFRRSLEGFRESQDISKVPIG